MYKIYVYLNGMKLHPTLLTFLRQFDTLLYCWTKIIFDLFCLSSASWYRYHIRIRKNIHLVNDQSRNSEIPRSIYNVTCVFCSFVLRVNYGGKTQRCGLCNVSASQSQLINSLVSVNLTSSPSFGHFSISLYLCSFCSCEIHVLSALGKLFHIGNSMYIE